MPTVQASGLRRSFGRAIALDGLELEAQAGEVVALLGPNGAGKTTAVRVMNGVLLPDAGTSRVLGLDPTVDGEAVRRRTGVLTENSGLDDRLSALENLTTYARIRGIPGAVARRRGMELLERFGLAARADASVQGLSTGQRKRVALARALLHEPEVLFLDEPTSGLDPAATREVLDLLAELARSGGRTIIVCTHFLTEASRLCQRMAIIKAGRTLAFGSIAQLASRLSRGFTVDVEVGHAPEPRVLAALANMPGVETVESSARDGLGAALALTLVDRAAVPRVVAALVTHEVPVHAVVPRTPTLEDVYFALTTENA